MSMSNGSVFPARSNQSLKNSGDVRVLVFTCMRVHTGIGEHKMKDRSQGTLTDAS
jgi:hypothetical protein